jgi:hypothetical protein
MYNRLTNDHISRILTRHSVPHFIRDGRIYADSMEAGTKLFSEVVDLTGCTLGQVRNWLGY